MGYEEEGPGRNGNTVYRFDSRIFGKRYRKRVSCPKSAVVTLHRRWEKTLLEQIGNPTDKRLLFDTINEYQNYVRGQKRAYLIKHEEAVFKSIREHFPENTLLNDIRRPHIEAYRAWRKRHSLSEKKVNGIADATVNKSIATLSSFFNWCIEREYYRRNNPTFRTKLRLSNERTVYLNQQQLSELFSKSCPRMRLILMLAVFGGLRAGECLSLLWSNVVLSGDCPHIKIEARLAKSKRLRVIPMPQPLYECLLELRIAEPNATYVVEYESKSIASFKTMWLKIRKRLSFSRLPDGTMLRFHDLRGQYARMLRMAGVSIASISTLLGHSSVAITEKRYANVIPPVDKGTVDKLLTVIDPKALIVKES